jgi:hypothetical protein
VTLGEETLPRVSAHGTRERGHLPRVLEHGTRGRYFSFFGKRFRPNASSNANRFVSATLPRVLHLGKMALSDGEIWTAHRGVNPCGLVVRWGGV